MAVHLLRDLDQRKRLELVTQEILVNIGRLTGQQADEVLGRGKPPPPAFDLTAREKTILRELSPGQDAARIAGALHIRRG